MSTTYRGSATPSQGGVTTTKAENIVFTPYGDLASTDVQAAIQELDDEKVSLAGDTMTGDLTVPNITATGTIDATGAVTFSSTMAVTGNATFSGDVSLGDSKYAKFGNDDDFTIQHDGSNTNLFNDVGDVYFRNYTNSGVIRFLTDNSAGVQKNGVLIGGATPYVRLYHDGNVKATTVSTGLDITGSLDVTDAATTRTNLGVDAAGDAAAMALALGG